MFRNVIPTAALAALTVSACATPTPPPPALLIFDRQDCAATPDLAMAISLTPEKEKASHAVLAPVSGTGSCLMIGAEAAPYALFALPADLDDKTFVAGSAVEVQRILAPRVATLDTNGTVVRTFASDEFMFRGPIYSVQFRPRANEAFVLISADPGRVGQQRDSIAIGTSTTTYPTGYGASNYTTGVDVALSHVFSFEGQAQVSVYDSDTDEDR